MDDKRGVVPRKGIFIIFSLWLYIICYRNTVYTGMSSAVQYRPVHSTELSPRNVGLSSIDDVLCSGVGTRWRGQLGRRQPILRR